MKTRKSNSLDVARMAEVSPATVSLVLNNRRDIAIAESTRERVRQAASKLGYRPNLLARNLLRGRTQTIGVVAPRVDSTFCGQILQGIQEACQEADYGVLLAHTLHNSHVEARQVELLLDHQVDGIITVTDAMTLDELPQRIASILNKGTPCIVIDDKSLAGQVDCLVSDDIAGARSIVDHLVKLGHHRIAHLSGGTLASSGRDRLQGYHDALQSAGISRDPSLLVGHSYAKTTGAASMLMLLNLPQPPTAVFAVNDELAAEAWRVIRQRGLRIPEDMALAGYANFEMSEYLELTTVAQDAREMGRKAAKRLLARIDNPALPPELITTPTRLLVRQTCGATTTVSNALAAALVEKEPLTTSPI